MDNAPDREERYAPPSGRYGHRSRRPGRAGDGRKAPGRPGRGDHGRSRKRPRGPGRPERPLHPGAARGAQPLVPRCGGPAARSAQDLSVHPRRGRYGRHRVALARARASSLARRGRPARGPARVVVADVDEESAVAAVERLREGGAEALEALTDITEPDEVGAMVERAIDAFGRFDVLVNNAGITGRDAPLSKITEDDWERVLGLNLTATFYCCRAAIPRMRE